MRVPPSLYAHTRFLELDGAALNAAHEHGGVPCTGCEVRRREGLVAALLASVHQFTSLHAVRLTGSLGCEWAEAVEFKRLRTSWAVYAHGELNPLVLGAEQVVLCFPRRVEHSMLSHFRGDVYLYVPCIEGVNPEALADVLDAVGAVVFSWLPSAKFTFIGAERWPGDLGPDRIRLMLGERNPMGRTKAAPRANTLVCFLSLPEFRAVAGEDVYRLLT